MIGAAAWKISMAKARSIIRRKGIYYLATTNKFIPVPTEEYPRIGVTKGGVLYFNPDWVAKHNEKVMAGLLVHEAHHVIRNHHVRGAPFWARAATDDDRRRIQWAMDLAQNDHILDSGWELPSDGVFTKDFGFPKNRTFEEYLKLLEDQEKQDEGGGGGGGGKMHHPCGGVCGNPSNLELEMKLDQKFGGGRTAREMAEASKQTLKGIAQAMRGTGAGNWAEKLLANSAPSNITWETKFGSQLMSMVGQIMQGGTDYSYERQSRRSMLSNVVSPALIGRQILLAIVVDTSASMNQPLLSRALTESMRVMQRMSIGKCWFIQADTRVAVAPKLVEARELRAPTIYGRGGTAFDPALQSLLKLKPRPHACLYFTDGDGPIKYKPPVPTIFGVIGKENSYHEKRLSAFGRVVLVDR